ncbi:MAG: DUF1559 domain-containing protein [Pirellulales bacterium]|nr:DUF1559 domain-containing protein [Pirellulales bacterium]
MNANPHTRDQRRGESAAPISANSGAGRGVRLRRVTAFTLVELLVVIAIIGVLVAMLLPAIQAAREAARRSSCQNNVAQLGLAVLGYEFSRESLPAGCLNPDGPVRNEPIGRHVSWVVQILPYIEQYNAYRLFDQEAGAYAPQNQAVREVSLALMTCPSYPGWERSERGGFAHSTYAGCHHHEEAPIDAKNTGLLYLNSRIRYRDMLDGSSQTILLAEMFPDEQNGLGWASGTPATLRNTGRIESWRESRERRSPSGSSAETRVDPLHVGGFGSTHPGIFLAAFADGSVRHVSENLEPEVLAQLGHRADGKLLKDPHY